MMTRVIRMMCTAALAAVPTVGLVGCDDNDGPLERAGERADDAADDVGDAVVDAGEVILDAVDDRH